ncbi:hypothetical protein C0989_011735, partial [Termitomyces sp. Mn162]
MSHSDSPVSAEEFSALRDSNRELQAMMQEILGRLPQVNSPSTAAPPAPTLPSAAPPLQGSSFVPPIAGIGVNGAYSSTASLSLRTRFPDVDAAVIGAIISHDFKAADLHKLDPVNRDKETAYTFNGATN